ncbi:hypothetical protein BJY01DRAFT_255241 [Aspergillus pseudoustus]|uniref:Glycosyl transferase n=1 Tax=Aspergillus pseudoustus TaxID=1810923 RepID=A0ABR4IM29_9EURO
MEAQYTGLHAVGWHGMLSTWSGRILAIIILVTIVLGCLYVLFAVGRAAIAHWKRRRRLSGPPTVITSYFRDLKKDSRPIRLSDDNANPGRKLKSFGVYLGEIKDPPTPAQSCLLSQWDVIVLNPLEQGVMRAAYSHCDSAHLLGRLDVQNCLGFNTSTTNDEVLQSLGIIVHTLVAYFKDPEMQQTPFHGVLLTRWEEHFQPGVLHLLFDYINAIGLDVWLEISSSSSVDVSQYNSIINMSRIQGIVYQNGTISSDGTHHDYFQMSQLRSIMKAFAGQTPGASFNFAMWEVVEDNAAIAHHALRRTFKWCNYNSAMSWIGARAALKDADIAASRTVANEPLSALAWLRDDAVARIHDRWRLNDTILPKSVGHDALYESLDSLLPDLAERLKVVQPPNEVFIEETMEIDPSEGDSLFQGTYAHLNPLSVSSSGVDYTSLGCFQLGLDCSTDDIVPLLDAQIALRDLDLLERIQKEELDQVANEIRVLLKTGPVDSKLITETSSSIHELMNLLCTNTPSSHNKLRVWVGLHSGFRTRSEAQVWGMYAIDPKTGATDIYLSNKATYRAGTILHTFLSSRRISRFECILAEAMLANANNKTSPKWGLPPRLVHDIEALTPAETLQWMRHLGQSTCDQSSQLVEKMLAVCKYQLLDAPSLSQLRRTSSVGYLSGKVTAEELVRGRLQWYQSQGNSSPDYESALAIFKDIDSAIANVLIQQATNTLAHLAAVMDALLQPPSIDARADFLALSIFCAVRKVALGEIYLEVLDRNPRPNLHHVQASCFAEFYAVGARCDAYFDMTPNELGRVLFTQIRTYYNTHPPPLQEEDGIELPSTYTSMDVDLDPNPAQEHIPVYYRITSLGIFAIPALIDIVLLTTVGRGLYLSAFMNDADKTMATAALMVALLLGGAFGTWITSGGSYYFCSMAFPAASMFAMTRFVAGVAVVLTTSTVTFIGIGIAQSFRSAIIFFVYLIILTTYLMVVSTLGIYEMPGHRFQSGRLVIVKCLPILLISPLLTTWLHHDIIIYPSVLASLLVVLLFAARRVLARWNSWYLDLPCVTEEEVVDWYQRTQMSRDPEGDWKAGTPPYYTIRQTLWGCIQKERAAIRFRRPKFTTTTTTPDPFVQRLAKSYPAVIFLLTWYCKYVRTRLPLPYSTTWNLQLKTAIESLVSMQKGLKQHSAFLHWVHSGQEVWGGLLYFALALMDKWTALLTGESIVGLSVSSETYRLAVGFGLAYYLMGAVTLDAVSQPLWALAHQNNDAEQVSGLESLRKVLLNETRRRRVLYASHFLRYSLLHIWAIAVTAALMWAFESTRTATQMYLAYVGAYSGLLWYQYSRIYARHRSDHALTMGTAVGFTTCMLLRLIPEHFPYDGVVGLAAGTWTTAVLSFHKATAGSAPEMMVENEEVATYTCSALDLDPEIPQSALSRTFGGIMSLPSSMRYKVDASRCPRITQILLPRRRSQLSRIFRAFPQAAAAEVLQRTAELWESGKIVVELVDTDSLLQLQDEPSFRTLCKRTSDLLHIIVITALHQGHEEGLLRGDMDSTIAEALVSCTAEHIFGWNHDHAVLAELLVHDDNDGLPIPDGIKSQLQVSHRSERERLVSGTEKTILRHLLLGIDIEQEWDLLLHDVQIFLLQRARGQAQHLPSSVAGWMCSRFRLSCSSDLVNWIARCDLSAAVAAHVSNYAQGIVADDKVMTVMVSSLRSSQHQVVSSTQISNPHHHTDEPEGLLGFLGAAKKQLVQFYQGINTSIKFTVLALVADPEYQRELHYVLRNKPRILAGPATRCLTGIWLTCKVLQDLIIPLVMLHGRDRISTLYKSMAAQTATIEKKRVALVSLDGPFTCFMHLQPDGSFQLYKYAGRYEQEPSTKEKLVSISTYTRDRLLRARDEYNHQGALTNSFVYEYAAQISSSSSSTDAGMNVPIQRQCLAGRLKSEVVCYDRRGYIVSGSALRGTESVQFRYWYADNATSAEELLRAEFVYPHITIEVAWSIPRSSSGRIDEWIPYPRVTAALFIQGGKIYKAVWTYDHKFHPTIRVTLDGAETLVPPMIAEDWFNVLQKPTVNSFQYDNPLVSFPSRMGTLSRLLRRNIKRFPASISQGRTHLWGSWRSSNEVDAVTARWLDERILRSSRILKPYWQHRDRAELDVATGYLNTNVEAILSDVDLSQHVSSWVPLAFKFSDLHSFGYGGDASVNTRTVPAQLDSTSGSSNDLHVLAMDTGTWPNEPGGVSACRRDLVNNLKNIRWHMIAESANDFGTPRFQVEQHVHSLTILPQWGLDFLHPMHGIFQRSLHSAIAEKACNTTEADIRTGFLPVLRTLVRCARMRHLDRVHVKEATQALVDLNNYFDASRSWNDVWMSDTVKQAWRELWLSDDVEGGTIPISQWLDAEKPTIAQLDNALDMWHRYLFIFSIPVPEKIPSVFQVSHHFTGATYGVLCKIKRQCILQVWDHCISFREITAFLSSAVSLDSIFVNNALISLGHLSCVLVLHHADIISPCAEYFNPGWEIELGTVEGTLQHRRLFSRRIDAIVNGIANMEQYRPAKRPSKTGGEGGMPTVVMLSHVRYVKDIKTAILAADVIVNNWGFRDYRLNVFGDMERAPGYSSECLQMIDSKDLRGHVFLMGLGDPLVALEDAWLFMNSSISEGLPLAMGEASLTGAPVVCTDVGSSFCMVTDPSSGKKFGEVVAPNDPTSLASAQIRILGLLGEWAAFAEDEDEKGSIPPPTLSLRPSAEEVLQISQRMYDKSEQRRRLGLLGRANIYRHFSSDRYLREHEQMLWIGDYRSRGNATSSTLSVITAVGEDI